MSHGNLITHCLELEAGKETLEELGSNSSLCTSPGLPSSPHHLGESKTGQGRWQEAQ